MIAACPHCAWSDEVEDSFANQAAECPSCENEFVISDQTQAPEPLKAPEPLQAPQEVAATEGTPSVANPYAVPSTSETLSENPDEEFYGYGGMSRGPYWGWNFGLNFVSLIPILGFIALIAGSVYIVRERCRNLGYSLWYGWALFIPFYNILVSFRFACCPEGYADHKTLDKTGKILLAVLITLMVLMMGVIAIAFSMVGAQH